MSVAMNFFINLCRYCFIISFAIYRVTDSFMNRRITDVVRVSSPTRNESSMDTTNATSSLNESEGREYLHAVHYVQESIMDQGHTYINFVRDKTRHPQSSKPHNSTTSKDNEGQFIPTRTYESHRSHPKGYKPRKARNDDEGQSMYNLRNSTTSKDNARQLKYTSTYKSDRLHQRSSKREKSRTEPHKIDKSRTRTIETNHSHHRLKLTPSENKTRLSGGSKKTHILSAVTKKHISAGFMNRAQRFAGITVQPSAELCYYYVGKDITINSANVVYCRSNCCYAATVYGDNKLQNIRNCAKNFTVKCSDYCSYFIDKYERNNKGDVMWCRSCGIPSKCNDDQMMSQYYCYSCRNCSAINSKTKKTECKGPPFCYYGLLVDGNKGDVYAVRGCIHRLPNVCKAVKARFQRKLPNSTLVSCVTCNNDTGSLCNDQKYVVPKCYHCRGDCVSVDNMTTVVDAPKHCCYSASIYGKRGIVRIRDVAKRSFVQCKIFCDHFKSNGVTVHCTSCTDDRCNDFIYNVATPCATCKNCNSVNVRSTFKCPDIGCCYVAVLKNNRNYYVQRGCKWKLGSNCTNACSDLRKDYLQEFPNGSVYSCDGCKSGDKAVCNAYEKIPSILCYKCNGSECDVISNNTKLTRCENNCCYSVSKFSGIGRENVRNCADKNITCNDYCDSINNGYLKENFQCTSCNDEKCNANELPSKFKCYQCTNCNQIDTKTPTVECSSRQCCYMARMQIIAYQPVNMARGCLQWTPGLNCTEQSTCKAVMDTHLEKCPYCQFQSCGTCKDGDMNLCNNLLYVPPSIKCYNCTDKDCMSVNTNSTWVKCDTFCCISATLYGKDGMTNIRKCAENTRECGGYCDRLRENSTDFDVIYCNNCATDLCNKEPMEKAFKCLKCWDCNNVSENTPLVDCKGPRCCYTAYLQNISSQPLYAVRDCIKWTLGLVCGTDKICDMMKTQHLQKYHDGRVGDCMTCNDEDSNGCNKEPYKPPSIKCYTCDGESCVGVYNNTSWIDCETMCCYATTSFGLHGYLRERGCATELRRCDKYCTYHTNNSIRSNPNHEVTHCSSCDHNLCNNKPMPESFACYNCTNCNKISVDTPLNFCRSPQCCYIAYVHNTLYKPLFAIRGCMKWSVGMDCGTTCNVLKASHKGPFRKCRTCEMEDISGCNRETYEPPSILCYNCSDCSQLSISTPMVKCVNLCCYSYTGFSKTGLKTERNCAPDLRHCHSYCLRHKKQPKEQQLHCESCGSHRCNNNDLQKHFKCYQCKYCDTVTTVTSLVDCISPYCCYSARVQDVYEGGFTIRGCIEWRMGMNCSTNLTCATVQSVYLNPETETLIRCKTCKKGDESKCNGATYISPVECYSCRGDSCNNVNDSTPTVKCVSRCCYLATTFGPSGHDNIRNCATGANDCNSYCNDRTQFLEKLKTQSVYCRSCTDYKCNREALRPRYQCYNCRRCNSVNSTTPLFDCISPDCYTAYVQDNPYENFYAIRGCSQVDFRRKRSLNVTCSNVKDEFIQSQKNGTFQSCFTCSTRDNVGCNRYHYSASPMCYQCNDADKCYDIENDIKDVKCPTQHCYFLTKFTKLSGYSNERSCVGDVKTCDGFCEEYVEYIQQNEQVEFVDCKCCNKFKCNGEKLPPPTKCYECTRCNNIAQDSKDIVHCRSPKCCYTAYMRDNQEEDFFANRGCGTWHPHTGCTGVILEVEKNHYKAHPLGDFEDCDICEEGVNIGCNNQAYDPAIMKIPSGPPSISCYNCERCNEINDSTPTVRCAMDKCCYRAAVQENPGEPLFATRGCMQIRQGQTCQKICDVFERRHMWRNPNGRYHVCIPCDVGAGDNCNSVTFPMYEDTQPQETIRCYNCTKCNKVNSKTRYVWCRSPACCYAAIVRDTDEDDSYVIRGCQDSKLLCNRKETCKHVTTGHLLVMPAGSVKTCITCNYGAYDDCNNHPLNLYQHYKKKQPPIKNCYQCNGCNRVTPLSGKIYCKNLRCCYEALTNTKPGETFVVDRGCYELQHGQSCDNMCDYFETNHKNLHRKGRVHVCWQCPLYAHDNCNDRTYPRDITGEYPLDMSMDLNPITCYDCRNCSRVSTETPSRGCRAAACCYTAYMRDHTFGSFYASRGCARYRRGRSCTETCKDVENDHIFAYPFGALSKCIPCHPGDPDYCNKYPFYFLRSPTVHPADPLGYITCYNCKNCYSVNSETHTTLCTSPACCYTSIVTSKEDSHYKVNRGCANPNHMGSCHETCTDVRANHLWSYPKGTFIKCVVCAANATDECNNKPIIVPPQTTTAPKITLCYKCDKCDLVDNTELINCTYPKLCFDAILETTIPISIRGCESSCDSVAELPQYLHTTIDNCLTCDSDECNNRDVNNVNSLIECYTCNNCDKIAPPDTHLCSSPECCYIVVEQDNTVNRGCNIKTPCSETCADQKAILADKYKQCTTCKITDTDFCNKPTDSAILEDQLRKLLIPQAIQPRPTTLVSRKVLIHCYQCTNCSVIISQRTYKCLTTCCYSALLKDNNDEVSGIRGCVEVVPGRTCKKFCKSLRKEHMSAHGKGDVLECETCTTMRCNNKNFT